MSMTDIEGLGFHTARDQVFLEGDPYDRIIVDIGGGETIEGIFWQERLSDIATGSSRFVTDRGARVGMTLQALRTLYPEGQVNIGSEEGGYFNFETPDNAFFQLDQTGVPATCFEYRGECPDLGAQRSIGYLIRDLSPAGQDP
jgi:hypothetical protein